MEFICDICNNQYKSYQSLWKHKKQIHKEHSVNIIKTNKPYTCSYCQKKFTRHDNMINHKKTTCKNKDIEQPNEAMHTMQDTIVETKELKTEVIKLKKEIEIIKKTQENKIIKKTQETINNGTVNNGNLNNGTINNVFYINKVGTENIHELTKKDVKEIFNKNIECVDEFVKKINFNKNLPSNHSFCTTNLDGPYLSVYDSKESKITKDRKKYFFEQLFTKSVEKMKELYKINKTHFNKMKQEEIESIIERLCELQTMNMNHRIYKEMIKKLNMLSYNERDIIQDTWKSKKSKYVPKTLEEDLERGVSESSESDYYSSDSDNELTFG